MTDWVEALASHAAVNDLGTPFVDLFVGMMDDQGQPGAVAAFKEYKGTTRETFTGSIDIPMLQVAVRAKSYKAAKDRIIAIRDLLKDIKNQSVQGVHFLRVAPDGWIKDIDRDAAGRQMFTADFEVWFDGTPGTPGEGGTVNWVVNDDGYMVNG